MSERKDVRRDALIRLVITPHASIAQQERTIAEPHGVIARLETTVGELTQRVGDALGSGQRDEEDARLPLWEMAAERHRSVRCLSCPPRFPSSLN